MKTYVEKSEPEFTPVVVTFELETPDEVRVFKELAGRNRSAAGKVFENSDNDAILLGDIIGSVYDRMCQV